MSTWPVWGRYRAQRRQLLALEQQTAREIDALWRAHVPTQVRPLYDQLITDYADELARLRVEDDGGYGGHVRVSPSWLEARLRNLQTRLRATLTDFAAHSIPIITHAQGKLALAGAQDATALISSITEPLGASYGVAVPVFAPSANALAAMQGRTSAGTPLASLFDTFGADGATAVADALRAGMASGSNPRVVARLFDTALGIPRSRALTIARTEMLGAYRTAALDGYRANRDVVEGWIWQAADDGRCCAMCAAMQGSEHSLDETLDSHPGCRCAMLPKTKRYADILEPLGIDASDIPETSISVQSGADWFAGLDASQQRAIIGTQAGYDAYQRGDVSLSDFVGVAHDATWGASRYQKSLKQLGITPKR